ncbi:hypothetical protein EJB05_25979, partial [Eragrostis curvula]
RSFADTGAPATSRPEKGRGAVLGLAQGRATSASSPGSSHTKSLVLLIAWLPAAVSVVVLGTVRIIFRHATVRGGARARVAAAKATGCSCACSTSPSRSPRTSSSGRPPSRAPHKPRRPPGLLVLFFLPFVVFIKQEYRIKKELEEDKEESLHEAAPTTRVTVDVEKTAAAALPMTEPAALRRRLRAVRAPGDTPRSTTSPPSRAPSAPTCSTCLSRRGSMKPRRREHCGDERLREGMIKNDSFWQYSFALITDLIIPVPLLGGATGDVAGCRHTTPDVGLSLFRALLHDIPMRGFKTQRALSRGN